MLYFFFNFRENIFGKTLSEDAKHYIENQRDDYTGQQGIALPVRSGDSSDNYNVQYTCCPEIDNETNQNHDHSSRSQLYSIASNPNEYDQSIYVASEDGVYDRARDRRHVENESYTYGHGVGGVYYISNQQRSHDEEGDSYGRVVDSVYDATGHNYRQTANVNNTYSRAMDTAFDTAGQIGTMSVRDDIYD